MIYSICEAKVMDDIKRTRENLYKQTLEEMKVEYEEVVDKLKEYEKLRTREFLLRKTIDYIRYLLEDPDECRFHLMTKEEEKMKSGARNFGPR